MVKEAARDNLANNLAIEKSAQLREFSVALSESLNNIYHDLIIIINNSDVFSCFTCSEMLK